MRRTWEGLEEEKIMIRTYFMKAIFSIKRKKEKRSAALLEELCHEKQPLKL